MSIWFSEVDICQLNKNGKNTIIEYLGIEFNEVGNDFLQAIMPVDQRTKQPLGILHGGASCVLAETVGTIAANLCLNPNQYYCVGLEINANHIRSITQGIVQAMASPLHLGKRTQLWEIKIKNEINKLICVSRLTVMVQELNKKSNYI